MTTTTYTLFDLVWKCLVELGTARSGTATGGSTTTLIDTVNFKNIDEDYFNDGSVFVLKDSAGASAAPEKEFSLVTNFVNDTQTATFSPALTAAIAAGDTYGIAVRRYPLYLLIQKINNALYLEGHIPVEDESISTVSEQLEYDLPANIAAQDLRQVFVSTNSATDAKEYYRPVVNWEIAYATSGASELRLQSPYATGEQFLLKYVTPHAELRVASDALNPVIHPDRVVYQVCADSMRWYKDKTRLRHLQDSIDVMELKAQRAKDRHPLPPLPSRQSRITKITRTLRMSGT
jgi:hypothetical protein